MNGSPSVAPSAPLAPLSPSSDLPSALFSHAAPDAVIAYCRGEAITAAKFLADARQLAQRLPPGEHVLNMCVNRYRFAVGLAACLLTQRVSLLPSTHTPEVIARLREFAPDALCLTDIACQIDMPQFQFPDLPPARVDFEVPLIPASQTAAIVFTSGSTGTPLPYWKTWGPLAACVREGASPLGFADGRRHALVGTVPSQHMYGFESAVLLALQSGNAFGDERPFYPADIATALARVPRPRTLVSTPIHLKTLLASQVQLPALDSLICATAPLSLQLARDVEARCAAPLLEIYGSTETGQIALRRSTHTRAWRLWPQVQLRAELGRVIAHGGHVREATLLGDIIDLLDDGTFLLHGRTADLVNVAGKRSSLGYLNAQLAAIAGVDDGAFFLREDAAGETGVARLAAVAVAPGLSAAALTEQLRQRIDPAFMPRPLIIVSSLPRNSTGKLTKQELRILAERQLRSMGAA